MHILACMVHFVVIYVRAHACTCMSVLSVCCFKFYDVHVCMFVYFCYVLLLLLLYICMCQSVLVLRVYIM